MSPHSRLESLPAELLSSILTWCRREDLINLAQTHSSLHAVCHQELINYSLTMKITSDNLKSWLAYFRKENTLLTRGARSLDIEFAIDVTMQDFFDAFDDIDLAVFDVDARPIHPDADRILPLPSSLRKLSLKTFLTPSLNVSSETLLILLFRSLPERCPHLEELTIQIHSNHPSYGFDKCIRRLKHLRKLYLNVWDLPNIPNRLSLLPASLTDLNLSVSDLQTQEDVAIIVPWVRRIRKIKLWTYTPQCTANVLMILSRGSATHLTELILREDEDRADPAAMVSLREALTAGLQEFSFLQPPIHTLTLAGPPAWSDSLHLPFLHTAVASTLTQLFLQRMDSCIFPSYLPWPRLQSLELKWIPKVGYQGLLTEPIFPVLTAIVMFWVEAIQAPEDLFPALEAIKWDSAPTPEQVASLIRHDIKRIDMTSDYEEGDLYEPLWEAMGGHTIGLITLEGYLPNWMEELASNGERIFPEFPNIREFIINWSYA